MNNFINDEELLLLVAQGNSEAYKLLFNRYRAATITIVRTIAFSLNKNVYLPDYYTIFNENFAEIVRKYDFHYGKFRGYYNKIMYRYLFNLVKNDCRDKDSVRLVLCLDTFIDEKEETYMIETVSEHPDGYEKQNIIENADVTNFLRLNSVKEESAHKTNRQMFRVINLRMGGLTMRQISEKTGLPLSTVKNICIELKKRIPFSKITYFKK